MTTLGEWITLLLLIGGTFGLSRLAYHRWWPWLRYYASVVYYAIDDYVQQSREQQAAITHAQYRDTPDIDQLKPASIVPQHTSTLPDETALIQHLARLTKPNGTYWLSANKVYAAVGGDRETVLAVIREVRGTPVANDDPYQFEKTGPRETYQRTGVKPLRG
jgi:hypothetical protein